MKVILATSSPYRKEAFRLLNIDFISKDSRVYEYFEGRPKKPKELVKKLSRLKAETVAKDYSTGIVTGFDSVEYFNGKILEKPKSKEEEHDRLRELSCKRLEFYTGIFMINLESEKKLLKEVVTEVLIKKKSRNFLGFSEEHRLKAVVFNLPKMRKLKDTEIKRYLNEDSRFNTYASSPDFE